MQANRPAVDRFRIAARICAAIAFITVPCVRPALAQIEVVHVFPPVAPAVPVGAPLRASDGHVYFVTRLQGAVLRRTAAGEVQIVHRFTENEGNPNGELIQASDGNLYGVVERVEGLNRADGMFRMTLDGVTTIFPGPRGFLHSLFEGNDGNFYAAGTWRGIVRITPEGAFSIAFEAAGFGGRSPFRLRQTPTGDFYGLALELPGMSSTGFAFRLTLAGEFTVLHQFGAFPDFPLVLIRARDGNFYGAAATSVFKLSLAGALTRLHQFTGPDGIAPVGLLETADGTIYGTTSGGGTHEQGVVFAIERDGTFRVLHHFADNFADAARPSGALLDSADGTLLGLSGGGAFNAGAIFTMTPDGAVSVVHSFARSSDGAWPDAAMTRARDGSLYGTTRLGGPYGLGTVFKMTVDGAVQIVHAFRGVDGALPTTPIVVAMNGTLYGSTESNAQFGGSTVFRITTDGVFTTLKRFSSQTRPTLYFQASDGNLYGGVESGPTLDGTIFRMSPAGDFTVLSNSTSKPFALVEADDGNFYGTAPNLGAFRMTPDGTVTTLDSRLRKARPLIRGNDGYLYGATVCCSSEPWSNVVFRLHTDGTATVIGKLTAGHFDPRTLTLASDGSFYGTAHESPEVNLPSGGSFQRSPGTIFRMTADGVVTTLGSSFFPEHPTAFAEAGDGRLYSTAPLLGDEATGFIFRLSPDGTPPITTATLSVAPAASGWHNTSVTVTLAAEDLPATSASGVRTIVYAATGAHTIAPTTVGSPTTSVTVTAEGETTLYFFAIDGAGNAETSQTMVVRIDMTAPTLTCSVTPAVIWPPNRQLVPVTASVEVSDALSGASAFQLVSVTSSDPATPSDDIVGWQITAPSVSGQLRATRSNKSTGRIYTLTYRGFDGAGNAASCAPTVVVPHRSP